MDTDYLESFIAVAEMKSFSKAAKHLHMTQPTLTMRVQALERRLDVPLFYRRGRGVELTRYGEIFLHCANDILAQLQLSMEALQREKKREKTEIRIGVTNPFAMSLFPHLLAHLYKKFPCHQLSVMRVGYSDEVFSMVKRGEAEVGFVNEVLNMEQVDTQHMLSDPILLVANPKHPFSDEHGVELQALEKIPIFYVNSQTSYWKVVLAFLSTYNVHLKNLNEVNYAHAIKRLVIEDEEFVTLLPKMVVMQEIRNGWLKSIPVYPPLPSLSVSMISRQGFEGEEILRYMLRQVSEIYAQMNAEMVSVNPQLAFEELASLG